MMKRELIVMGKIGAMLFRILILLALTTGPSAWAANYYVDFQGGSDTNAGTSTASAWKRAPGDANATGNALRTLAAGDTIIFKGGWFMADRLPSVPVARAETLLLIAGTIGRGWRA